jgi:hypothetical protein
MINAYKDTTLQCYRSNSEVRHNISEKKKNKFLSSNENFKLCSAKYWNVPISENVNKLENAFKQANSACCRASFVYSLFQDTIQRKICEH